MASSSSARASSSSVRPMTRIRHARSPAMPAYTSPLPGAAAANETRPYDEAMATASPSPTPNPDATKFTLDTTLPASFNVTNAQAARNNRFAEDVFAAGGVAAIFGVNDFVTVTRQPGADWGPIVAAVQAAAEAHL